MSSEDRLKFVNGYGEYFLHVDSDEIERDVEFIKKSKVGNLILNASGDYAFTDLEWLSSVGDRISRLVIASPMKGVFDYGGLRHCRELTRLKVNNYNSGVIDVSGNLSLKELDVANCRHLVGLERLIKLERLIATNLDSSLIDVAIFGQLENLQFLSISNTSLKDLCFLRGSSLNGLAFNYCKSISLAGLPDLGVRDLAFEKCKNLQHVELIYDSNSIERLTLVDSAQLSSAKDLVRLDHLKVLILLGSSYLQDGDLDPLKGRLEIFSFDDKRHYNCRFKEFGDFLIS